MKTILAALLLFPVILGAQGIPVDQIKPGFNGQVVTTSGGKTVWGSAAGSGCAETNCVINAPSNTQVVTQPGSTSLNVNRINNVMHADLFAGADIGAKINTAFAACPVTSGCQVVLPPGNSYPYTTKIIIPTALQYYSLDCSHSTLVWGGTGDAIQVSSRNDDRPTGDITGCYIQNNTGNTSSTAAIHQLPRAQFTYRDNTIVGFNNSGGGAFLLDNIAESWGGYSERTSFYNNIVSDNKYGWKFYGNNGGTDSFARTLMYGNTCNTFGSINETCILVTSPTSGSTTAHLYDSHIDIRGNLGGTSTGVSLTNGGVIRLSEFTTGFEDNGSGTATGIYVDSASGVFNNSGNVSLELSANPVVNLGTSDQYSAPILSNAWTLQAPPDYFGQHQSRNPKFNWDFANIRLGQPWAESGNPNPALGYFQLYNRVTSNGDPEVDAAPSTGNKQFNTLFATAGKVGIGPGFGPDATHGQVAGRVAFNTLDVAGDMLADFSAQVPRFTDLNTLTRCGMYTVLDGVHAPPGSTAYVHVFNQCDGAGTGYNFQIASSLTGTSNQMWMRTADGGTWNAWSQFATGPVPFGQISSDSNTTAAMICGNGCSMNFFGTGTINASSIAGVSPTNNPTIGYVPTATSTTTYSWQPPSGGGGAPTGTGFAHYTSGVLDTAAIGETGTGTVVRSVSPALTGTTTAVNLTVSGTCTGCGSGSTGISGATSGQALIAGSATTATSSKALAGSGSALTTGPTTSTTGDIASFTGTAGQIADSGVLAANLVTLTGTQTITGTKTFSPASGADVIVNTSNGGNLLNNGSPASATQAGMNIYGQSYWTSLSDFTVSGTTPTITNGEIVFATNASNWDSSSIALKQPITSDDSTDMEVDFTYGTGATSSSTTCTIGIGKASLSGGSFSTSAAYCASGGTQQIQLLSTFYGSISGSLQAWPVSFTPAVGDAMQMYFSQRGPTFQITVVDATQLLSTTVSYTFAMLGVGQPIIANTGYFKISGSSTGLTVTKIKVGTQQPYQPNVLVVGDSKNVYAAQSGNLRFSELIKPTLGPVANIAGPGDNSAAMLAAVPYIISLHPTYVIVNTCRNDISGGVVPAPAQTAYTSSLTAMRSAGIKLILMLPIPETTLPNQSACTTFINTFPDPKIDVTATTYGPAWSNAVDLSIDTVHPSTAGHALIAFDIMQSGFITPRSYQTSNDFKPWPFIPNYNGASTLPTTVNNVPKVVTPGTLGDSLCTENGTTFACTDTGGMSAQKFVGLGSGAALNTNTASNTDLAGILTLSGGSATYTFAGTHTSSPVCVASDNTATNAVKTSTSTTVLTITGTGTDVVSYICVGRN